MPSSRWRAIAGLRLRSLFRGTVAERALAYYWRGNDQRPWHAIRIARRYAYGLSTAAERDAAGAAARDAAGAVAWAGMTVRLWEYLDGTVTPEGLRPYYETHDWLTETPR